MGAIRIETIMLSHKRDHPEKDREINPMFVTTIKGARRLGGKGTVLLLEQEEGAFVEDALARRNLRGSHEWAPGLDP